jgi:hypothetical protein
VACDHCKKLENDIQHMCGFGLKAYRFPPGWGEFSPLSAKTYEISVSDMQVLVVRKAIKNLRRQDQGGDVPAVRGAEVADLRVRLEHLSAKIIQPVSTISINAEKIVCVSHKHEIR